jgi:Inovirus Coat protein B
MFKKTFAVAVSSVAVTVAAPSVFAAEGAAAWDYTGLTSSIDFSTISVGVLAVAGILAGVYAGIKGAKIVLGFLRG